ncbi:FG-GAP-like repeat-containing protein [Spirosoma panaciterrae]|uniref:FG-GAP-like repeat-containing protein n=1 Tax=Spirosoma panaciterrae TaxID=496058 RepID=UPI0003A52B56|nr:FG-GAP-like repeat-containing protein [Spirosoma panaciterrae]
MKHTFTFSFVLMLSFLLAVAEPTLAQSLGDYPSTSMLQGGVLAITPNDVPVGVSGLIATASPNFKGVLTADPATGVVRISNAQPVGVYTVTVKGIVGLSTIQKTFSLTVSTGAGCTGKPYIGYTESSSVSVGNSPAAVAMGDMNNDGKLDIVAVNASENTVSVRLGNGYGGYSGSISVPVGTSPQDVVLGDVNSDGKLDILTANQGANTVSVRIGTGTGSVTSARFDVAVGAAPRAIALADMDQDGKLDVITANSGTGGTVSLLFGTGAGGFVSRQNATIPTLANPTKDIAVGDINNDGYLDFLAVSVQNSSSQQFVYVRMGSASGAFTAGADLAIPDFPGSIYLGDMYSDGKLDVAVGYGTVINTGMADIWRGNGAGGFTKLSSVTLNGTLAGMADLDNNKWMDLLVRTASGKGIVRLGNQVAEFDPRGATEFTMGSAAIAFATADVNSYGWLDIVATHANGTASVVLGGCEAPPVASANANQIATVGVPFSYTVNAFGDDLNPNNLTYTATINPANGLSFNPSTRVISGTPTTQGVSSVTITATDPSGQSASTSFSMAACTAYVISPSVNPVCIGQFVTLTVQEGTSYQWKGPKNFTSTAQNPGISPFAADQAGVYSVTVTTGITACPATTATLSLTAATSSPDYPALVDLYTATGGTNWTNKTGWLTGCSPCGWYGVTCNTNGRVTGLSFPRNRLNGTLPASLSALTNLQVLDLTLNNVTAPTPELIRALPNLTELKLESISVNSDLIASLSTLRNLKVLDLTNTGQDGFPTGVLSLTTLESLNLSYAYIPSIPDEISQLVNLKNLNMFATGVSGNPPAALGKLTNLQTLNMSQNLLSGCWPASLTALCGGGRVIDFSGNSGLPGGGDFTSFCTNRTGICVAPQAVPNTDQTATVGIYFQYIVKAFANPAPYNQVNYSVTITPANGLVYNNYGRAIMGIPTSPGVLTVVVTGSNTEGTSVSTSFLITVSAGCSHPDYQALYDFARANNVTKVIDSWFKSCDLCTWDGITCNANGRVSGIRLTSNTIFGNMDGPQTVIVIPESFSALTNLEVLDLSDNQLEATIPSGLSVLTGLKTLNLSNSRFTGPIPDWFSKLPQLSTLLLNNNFLTGSIPDLPLSLTAINMSSNRLSGTLPTSLTSLTQLKSAYFFNNTLSGCFPTSYSILCGRAGFGGNPDLPLNGDLSQFCASNPYLARVNSALICLGNPVNLSATGGTSFQWKGPLGFTSTERSPSFASTSLEQSGVYSVTASFGADCLPSSGTVNVAIETNQDVAVYNALVDLYTATNGPGWKYKTGWLQGCNPCGWAGVYCDGENRVTSILLQGNQMVGTLPASFSALNKLSVILLDGNQLKGPLPSSLSNFSNLIYLGLSYNQFTGTLPTHFSSSVLEQVDLSNNQLNGSIPASYSSLPKLKYLYLDNNQLSGCIPISFLDFCARNGSVKLGGNVGLPGGGDFSAFCATSAGACSFTNTAPVSATNAGQIAIVNQPFDYSVSAFTDAETPGALSYSASINPANGFSFDPKTRAIAGTPQTTGISTVLITATDPQGLTASTGFTITVNAAPCDLTVTAQPSATTINVGQVLSLSATGGTSFLWKAPSGVSFTGPATSAIVSASLAVPGPQSFTIVVSDGDCRQTKVVSVTAINGPDLTPVIILPNSNFPVGNAQKQFIVSVQEVGWLPTAPTPIAITVSVPTGYMLSFSATLPTINVSGGSSNPVPVDNANWSVSNDLSGQQLTIMLNSGQVIEAGSQRVLGFTLTRTTANSGSVSNITVNVTDDQGRLYDINPGNNVYARIISGL